MILRDLTLLPAGNNTSRLTPRCMDGYAYGAEHKNTRWVLRHGGMEQQLGHIPKFPTPQHSRHKRTREKGKEKGRFGIIALFRSGRDASRVGKLLFLPPRRYILFVDPMHCMIWVKVAPRAVSSLTHTSDFRCIFFS